MPVIGQVSGLWRWGFWRQLGRASDRDTLFQKSLIRYVGQLGFRLLEFPSLRSIRAMLVPRDINDLDYLWIHHNFCHLDCNSLSYGLYLLATFVCASCSWPPWSQCISWAGLSTVTMRRFRRTTSRTGSPAQAAQSSWGVATTTSHEVSHCFFFFKGGRKIIIQQ